MTVLNLTIAADADDTHQGAITNDSGRTFTSSGLVTAIGTLSPGSHGPNDEYSAGFEFTGAGDIVGKTINSSEFSIVGDATYSASPDVVSYHLSAHDADTPSGLTTTDGDLNSTNRPRTTADAGEWVLTSITGGVRYTRVCTAVIQELADRPSFNGTIIMLQDTHANTTQGQWQDFDQLSAELDIDYGSGVVVLTTVNFRKYGRPAPFQPGVGV